MLILPLTEAFEDLNPKTLHRIEKAKKAASQKASALLFVCDKTIRTMQEQIDECTKKLRPVVEATGKCESSERVLRNWSILWVATTMVRINYTMSKCLT